MSNQKQTKKPVKGAVEAAGEILDRVGQPIATVTKADSSKGKVNEAKVRKAMEGIKKHAENVADIKNGKKPAPTKVAPKAKPLPQGALQEALTKAAPAVKAAVKKTRPQSVQKTLDAAERRGERKAGQPGAKVAKRVADKGSFNRAKPTALGGVDSKRVYRDGNGKTFTHGEVLERTKKHVTTHDGATPEQTARVLDGMLKDVKNPQRRHRRPTRAALKAKAEQLVKEALGWGLVLTIPLVDGKPTVQLAEAAAEPKAA